MNSCQRAVLWLINHSDWSAKSAKKSPQPPNVPQPCPTPANLSWHKTQQSQDEILSTYFTHLFTLKYLVWCLQYFFEQEPELDNYSETVCRPLLRNMQPDPRQTDGMANCTFPVYICGHFVPLICNNDHPSSTGYSLSNIVRANYLGIPIYHAPAMRVADTVTK